MSTEIVVIENVDIVSEAELSRANSMVTKNVGDYVGIARNTDDIMLVMMWIETKDSDHTKQQYQRVYNHIDQYMDGLPIQEWQLADLIEWSKFEGEKIAPSTMRIRINAVKSLLSFAQRIGYTSMNLGRLLTNVKDNRNVKAKVLSRNAVNSLMTADMNNEARAIIYTLYYTGMRVSEVIKIRWSEISESGRKDDTTGEWVAYHRLYVLGKGNKERTIILHPSALAAMRALSEDRQGYVFKSRRANKQGVRTHVTRRNVNRIIKPITAEINQSLDQDDRFVGSVSAHWFRHTSATRQLENGASPQDVQNQLGHASLNTTTTYVHSGNTTVSL